MSEDHDHQRRRLAYRRAAYAVARQAQGHRPHHISLDRPGPEADEGGRAWPVDLGSAARHRLEMEILARWAGLTGEARACLDDRPPEGGWAEALEPIAALGRRVTRGAEENDAYLEWLRRRSLGLLDLPGMWPAVEAVAEALLESGTLGAKEAGALISGTQRSTRRRTGIAGFLRGIR
jgi:hypothetical protein